MQLVPLLLLAAAAQICRGLKLCQLAERWTHNGRDLVRDYRSDVLLVAFVPLDTCGDRCDQILTSYEQMIRDENDTPGALIVAPQSAAAHLTRDFAARHPTLRFEHESDKSPIWRWFSAGSYDNYIFDRCNRLTEKLLFQRNLDAQVSSQNELTRHLHNTTSRLRHALNYAKCGWCQYDEQRLKTVTVEPNIDSNAELAAYSRAAATTVFGGQPEIATVQPPQQPPEQKPIPSQSSIGGLSSRMPQPIVHPPRFVVNVDGFRTTDSTSSTVTSPTVPVIPKIAAPFRRQRLQQYASSTTTDLPYHNYPNTVNDKASRHLTNSQSHLSNHLQQSQTHQQEQLRQQQIEQQSMRERKHQNVNKQQRQWHQQYIQQQISRYAPLSQQEARQQQQWPEQQQERQRQQWPQQSQPQWPQQQQLQQQDQPQQYFSRAREVENPLEKSKATNDKQQPIQYAKDTYADRYQYRLHSDSFNEAQRQRATERRQDVETRRRDETQRHQQLEAFQRAREQQRLEQLEAQQRAVEQQRRADEERLNRQSRPSAAVEKHDAAEPAPLYPDGAAGLDYYEDEDEWTTPPTYLEAIKTPSSTVNPVQPLDNRDYGFNLPCESYNDNICYQQQTQLKPNEIHRCCRNRILLTDQCRPGKCSNVTQQLCCIQKFLQAKLSCCNDEKQLEVNTAGDHFNRCCHGNFITDDDSCCIRSYASAQWRTIHELCHPNVDVDLSRVRVPVLLAGTSLTTEFDFGKTDRWNFTCKYGTHVPQFSYNGDGASGEIYRRR